MSHTPVHSDMVINCGTENMSALKPDITTCLKSTALKDSLTLLCLRPSQIYILLAFLLLVPSFFVDIIDLASHLPICPHFLPFYASCIILIVFFSSPYAPCLSPSPTLALISYLLRFITQVLDFQSWPFLLYLESLLLCPVWH